MAVILISAIWVMIIIMKMIVYIIYMHAARGIDKLETGTPKKVDDPSIVIHAIDMDWELNTMRKREHFKAVSIFSEIFSDIQSEKGRNSAILVSQLFLYSQNALQDHEASHSICFLHSG